MGIYIGKTQRSPKFLCRY